MEERVKKFKTRAVKPIPLKEGDFIKILEIKDTSISFIKINEDMVKQALDTYYTEHKMPYQLWAGLTYDIAKTILN